MLGRGGRRTRRQLAVAHLLSAGTGGSFVDGPTTIPQCADRRDGARKAVRDLGLSPAEALIEVTNPTLNADGGEAALDILLADARPPTGIFCVNDITALGVLRGLLRRGLSVPGDMALVGYDDVEFAGLMTTPLTSVRQPSPSWPGRGGPAADQAAAGPDHRHKQLLFQPELVVRESSAG